jgi:hypothetical protein
MTQAFGTFAALTGTVDQAALHGLLRQLYSLGVPLISVNCLAQVVPGTALRMSCAGPDRLAAKRSPGDL